MAIRIQVKFRGVPAYYQDVDSEIGRRTVLKEFPGRDRPYVEDLGQASRKFTIDLFVLGANYQYERDQLRDALETPGPGLLEHPYWGDMTVTVHGPVRVRESTKRQGMATFHVTFVESGNALAIADVVRPATATALVDAANTAETSAVSAFAAVFSVIGVLAATVQKAIQLVQSAATTLNAVRGKIASALQVINDTASAIQDVADTAASLIRTPLYLANAIAGLVSTVLAAITEVTQAFTDTLALLGIGGADAVASAGSVLSDVTRGNVLLSACTELGAFGADLTTLPTSTEQERIAAANQTAFVLLVKSVAACELARTAAALTWDSVDQARQARDGITTIIDAVLIDPALRDEQYAPLANLRAAVVRHLDQVAGKSDELYAYTPTQTTPSLAIAYQLYGDVTREPELLLRNPQLRDPTAVPGGTALQVKHA